MSSKSLSASRRPRLTYRPLLYGCVGVVALSLLAGAVVPSSYLSPLTSFSPPVGPFGTPLWLHFLGYATLGGVLMGVSRHLRPDRGFALPFAVGAGYGVLVEALHALVPYRTFSILDVAANVLGAGVGVLVVWALVYVAACHRANPSRF